MANANITINISASDISDEIIEHFIEKRPSIEGKRPFGCKIEKCKWELKWAKRDDKVKHILNQHAEDVAKLLASSNKRKLTNFFTPAQKISKTSHENLPKPNSAQRTDFIKDISLAAINSTYKEACSGLIYESLSGQWARSHGIYQSKPDTRTISKIHENSSNYLRKDKSYCRIKSPECILISDGWSHGDKKFIPIILRGLTNDGDNIIPIEHVYGVFEAPTHCNKIDLSKLLTDVSREVFRNLKLKVVDFCSDNESSIVGAGKLALEALADTGFTGGSDIIYIDDDLEDEDVDPDLENLDNQDQDDEVEDDEDFLYWDEEQLRGRLFLAILVTWYLYFVLF